MLSDIGRLRGGKLVFVSGPHDTPVRIRAITRALEASRGTGGWDDVVTVSPEL